jgi:hypothetical protein
MAPSSDKRNGLTTENLSALQKFIEQVKRGEIMPLKEKTDRARENLKRAGLI